MIANILERYTQLLWWEISWIHSNPTYYKNGFHQSRVMINITKRYIKKGVLSWVHNITTKWCD